MGLRRLSGLPAFLPRFQASVDWKETEGAGWLLSRLNPEALSDTRYLRILCLFHYAYYGKFRQKFCGFKTPTFRSKHTKSSDFVAHIGTLVPIAHRNLVPIEHPSCCSDRVLHSNWAKLNWLETRVSSSKTQEKPCFSVQNWQFNFFRDSPTLVRARKTSACRR